MTGLFELLYLLNIYFIWFSWNLANQCFEDDHTRAGWLNIFASALNAAIVADHFF